ncbi:MAG: phosphoserine phosphatase, partial [Methylobacteriaceae bacterium]|nr:phosphoserine phosphatase [Methylobacteriaceae bacterium]
MTHVATLVNQQDHPVHDEASIARAAALLPNARAPDWLAPQIAADIPFEPVGAIESREVADG